MRRKKISIIGALVLGLVMSGCGSVATHLEPNRLQAVGDPVLTFDSDAVVTNSGYVTTYDDDDWSLSIGGNNVSAGYNKNNVTSIPDTYCDGTVVPESSYGWVAVTKSAVQNVGKLTFEYTAGSGTTDGHLALFSSANGSTYSIVSLSAGTQGTGVGTANTTTTFQFETISSAYYAIVCYNLASKASTTVFRFDYVTAVLCEGDNSSGFGTLDHIKITTPATKSSFETGETFSSSGLILTAYDNAVEASAHTQTVSTGYSTNFDGHKFVSGDIGTDKTVTVTYLEKTATYKIDVMKGPDFVLDAGDNLPAGISNKTNTDVGEGQVGGAGIKYGYYAIQTYDGTLEFNKSTNGAYICNNETYDKYISKIRVTLSADNYSKLTMYKGDEAVPSSVVVTSNDNGLTRTYDFNNDSEFFALKQTTTNTYVKVVKIEIFLGSNASRVDEVYADIKQGTYYAGNKLSSSDFDVLVTWTEGKEDTIPTEGFTWKVNGVVNGTLAAGNNTVIVIYQNVESEPFVVVGTVITAVDTVEGLTTKTSLSYSYDIVDGATDKLNFDFIGVSGTTYTDWDSKEGKSGSIYAGQTAGGNSSVQLRTDKNTSGIVITSGNPNHYVAKKITIKWNTHTSNDRTLNIYGKSTAYTDATDLYKQDATPILTTTYTTNGDTTVEFTLAEENQFEFYGFRSNASAMYIDSIEIQWGNPRFTYSNVAVRFSGMISETLWNSLITESTSKKIDGYGVLIGEKDALKNKPISTYVNTFNGTTIRKFFVEVTNENEFPATATDRQKGDLEGKYYIWNVKKIIDENDLTAEYTAAAFVVVDGEPVFLNQVTASAPSVAAEYIVNNVYDMDFDEGALFNLAEMA